jgi:DNA polymerase (family 10)
MSQGSKRPLAEALAVAEEIQAKLATHCEQIEIAGSIRRKREMVGDIELVAVPKRMKDLLGDPVPKAKTALDLFFEEANFTPEKNGDRYKAFSYGGWKVDLYTPEADRWGLRLLVSTGSRAFNIWMVEALRQRNYRMVGGQVVDEIHRPVPLWVEADVFDLLGLPYVEPADRHDGIWYGIVRKSRAVADSGAAV